MTDPPAEASYRALAAVPSLARALLGMQISRIGQSMVGIALVLFTLDRYHSPALAGFVTFVSIAPGIVVSPLAGAILDRHGRTRFIVLDFIVAMAALVAIGVLAMADRLPPWLLIVIAALSALTGPLSSTGLRSLFPLMAPRHLWERLNAVDSNGYVVATIFGPPLAAAAVALLGGPPALILVGLVFGLAALILWPVPDPETNPNSSGSLFRDAWLGLGYTWSNRTLRGLGFSITTLNLAGGVTTIVVPLIVLNRLGLGELAVGGVFAVSGVTGMISGLIAGRMDTRDRERALIFWPMLAYAPAMALLLVGGSVWPIVLAMAVMGVINGPMDVAMFTVRQRRTDPAWLGRAFAVSMSFNFAGYPIGSAIAGTLASSSIEAAIILGVIACLVAAFFTIRLIPAHETALG